MTRPYRPPPSDDIASVPPGKIRSDEARELLTLLSADTRRSIELLIDSADVSPEYRAGLEAALDRADVKIAAIIDDVIKPKADA